MDERSRRELASFLRSRRERISPASVGLPTGSRRRTSGLRREEVAVLAGLSPTWYTYLEQGRDIQPSGEVLNSLARVLRLSEDERRYLFDLAHGPGELGHPLSGQVRAAELIRQIVDLHASSALPVYAADQYCDVVAWNPAATEWYADWASMPDRDRNLLKWMLGSAQARSRLVDWTDDVRDTIARWRVVFARESLDERMRQLWTECSRLHGEFTTWWNDHDVLEHRTAVRRLRHDRFGERALRVIPMQTPECGPCIIAVHVPATAG